MGNLPKIWVETLKRLDELEARVGRLELKSHSQSEGFSQYQEPKPEPKPEHLDELEARVKHIESLAFPHVLSSEPEPEPQPESQSESQPKSE